MRTVHTRSSFLAACFLVYRLVKLELESQRVEGAHDSVHNIDSSLFNCVCYGVDLQTCNFDQEVQGKKGK